MTSDITLYYLPEDGTCRTVMLAANIIGVKLKLKYVNVYTGQNLTPEYLKLNPMHSVPTLTDGDFAINESRAIITYLADKYSKKDSLYPKKDLKARAKINQWLFFDISSLYSPLNDYFRPVYYGAKTFNEGKMHDIKKAFNTLNSYLNESKFLVGDKLTLADIAVISSVATAIAVFDFDLKPYANVETWFKTVKAVIPAPAYKEIIEDNGQKIREMMDTAKAKNNQS